jgi:tRNA A37 methylthiotransferase MiaB
MGRTGSNKIVVFEGGNELVGELLDVEIEQANGFSLYGNPRNSSSHFLGCVGEIAS